MVKHVPEDEVGTVVSVSVGFFVLWRDFIALRVIHLYQLCTSADIGMQLYNICAHTITCSCNLERLQQLILQDEVMKCENREVER
jgi:hypothetical protein